MPPSIVTLVSECLCVCRYINHPEKLPKDSHGYSETTLTWH